MVRVRKGLAGELDALHHRMLRMMEASLRGQGRTASRSSWCPPADLYETDAEVIVRIEVAGIDPASLDITLEETLLRVAGERPACMAPPGCTALHQMEIDYGPFERLFTVPAGLDGDAARARLEGGFLEICLPKAGRVAVRGGSVGG